MRYKTIILIRNRSSTGLYSPNKLTIKYLSDSILRMIRRTLFYYCFNFVKKFIMYYFVIIKTYFVLLFSRLISLWLGQIYFYFCNLLNIVVNPIYKRLNVNLKYQFNKSDRSRQCCLIYYHFVIFQFARKTPLKRNNSITKSK